MHEVSFRAGLIGKSSARDNLLAAGLRGSAARVGRQGALRHESVRRTTSAERYRVISLRPYSRTLHSLAARG